MKADNSYKKALVAAVTLHIFLGILLFTESATKHPTLSPQKLNQPGEVVTIDTSTIPDPQIVKAVSVNSLDVKNEINRLQQKRNNELKKESERKQAIQKQLDQARAERLQEQERVHQLKEEADKIAIARKKQAEVEQERLKNLALEKAQEIKRLEALKQQTKALELKQLEEKKQAEFQKKQQAEAKARAEQEALKASEERAKKAELAVAQAKLAGEVDKYKALIINAIGQRWILPENVDNTLSSQFRIRLAPDGAVLEVSLTRGSGDSLLDRSAQAAIYKASPLPVPNDPATFNLFRDISLTVRPQNVRG